MVRRSVVVLAAVLGVASATAASQLAAQERPIVLSVDATDAPRRIFHVRESIPVSPGPVTLAYPKWIPGEHGAEGPITDLVGLRVSASGKPIPWKRESKEMWHFDVIVPEGATSLEVTFDYVASPASYTTATAKLAWINWWSVMLYPRGTGSNELTFRAALKLPAGWKYGTALPGVRSGDEVTFSPVSLVTLIDSPVLAGEYFRTVDLAPGDKVGHFLDIAGASPGSVEISEEDVARYRRLVAEARGLFGPGHYRTYHLLLSVSDQVDSTGLEHHESSDNRASERALRDETARRVLGTLLSHEYVHSWNGKYRTPAGLVSGITDDYQAPVDSELLWVYEGLTEYYGEVLGARSGLRSPELFREALALNVARMDRQAGRQWRPLVDTATAAQLLYYGRPAWASWRRGVDFYSEGALVWLDADVLIRQKSGGRKSLDDFVRAFHGGPGGAPAVKTYTADDVYAALNAVVPHDWAGFFRERVYDLAPRAPRSGIENGGWKLVYREARPGLVEASDVETENYDFWDSLGIVVHGDGTDGPGLIVDVVPEMPAAAAGVAPGSKLVAVGGRRYRLESLRDALRRAREHGEPTELLVENQEIYGTHRVDYRDGERYPWLERDASKPDLLSAIGAPRSAPASSGRPGL